MSKETTFHFLTLGSKFLDESEINQDSTLLPPPRKLLALTRACNDVSGGPKQNTALRLYCRLSDCVVSAFCVYQLHSCTSTRTTYVFLKKSRLKSE